MSASWVTFLFEAANFLLLAAVLGWAFFKPVRAALERRRAELEAENREADEKLARAEGTLAEAAKQRSELEGELSSLRERLRQEAEQEKERLLDAARERAQRERKALRSELAAARRGQAKRLAVDAAATARQIVVRLLERIDGPDLDQALVAAAGRELEKLAATGPLAPVIVESASPIAEEALGSLAQAAGVGEGEVSSRDDPELGAGVRIVTARGVVDASARGLAAHAERALLAQSDAEALDDG